MEDNFALDRIIVALLLGYFLAEYITPVALGFPFPKGIVIPFTSGYRIYEIIGWIIGVVIGYNYKEVIGIKKI